MLEGLTKKKRLERIQKMFVDSVVYDRAFQQEAHESFRFRDGIQWTDEEKAILNDERRPVLTFNLIKASIDLVMGMNEETALTYRATPVGREDGFLCEVLNDAVDWVSNTNDFAMEENGALESAAICGRGWVAIDFVPDPKRFGEIVMTEINVPVHEVHFDPAARRATLEDAGYIFWDRWLTELDFRMRYPKYGTKKIDDLVGRSKEMTGVEGLELPSPGEELEIESELSDEDSDYNQALDPADGMFYDKNRRMIRVVHMEYWEPYKRYFGYDPENGNWVEFESAHLKTLKDAYQEKYNEDFPYEILMDKKVKWVQFCGDDILFEGDSPMPFDGFSIVPIVAFRDVSMRTNQHFGLVRLMKDPQKEVNKRWSQALNILNNQVAPGLFAETQAFVNQEQAQISLKQPGSITWITPGTINQGRLKEREIPRFPDAPMKMEEFSQNIIKKITGINPDLLGEDRGRQEPGVVVRLRQQQGVTLLKPLFKSFNYMKQELFKRQLAIIMAYMPDEQWLRILGQNDRYTIDEQGIITDQLTGLQANIRDAKTVEYNVTGEGTQSSMSKRMMELQIYMEMMQSQIMPVPPKLIVERMELPESQKIEWLQYIEEQQAASQQQQEEMLALEAEQEDRKIAVDEQKNIMEFLVDVMKIYSSGVKDEAKINAELLKTGVESEAARNNLIKTFLDFQAKMETAENQKEAAKMNKGNNTNVSTQTKK